MLLQMVPGPLGRFSENILDSFIMGQRLDLRERLIEQREREDELAQAEMERAMAQQDAVLNSLLQSPQGQAALTPQVGQPQTIQAAGQTAQVPGTGQVQQPPAVAPGQLSAIANADSPDQRVALEQIGNEAARRQIESPETSVVQRIQAGQQLGLDPDEARSAGRRATLDDRIAEVTGDLPEPFRELGGRFMQVASEVGTDNAELLFEQQFERIREQNPTEAEELENSLVRARTRAARESARTRRAQREVAERELDQLASPEDVVTAFTTLPGSNLGEEEAAQLVQGLGVENAQSVLGAFAEEGLQEHLRFKEFAVNLMFQENPATGTLEQARPLSDARRIWQQLGRGPGTPDETFQQDLAVTVGAAELPDSDGGEEITDTEQQQIRDALAQKWQGLVDDEALSSALDRALASGGRNLNLTEEERESFDAEGFFGPGFEDSPANRFFQLLGGALDQNIPMMTPTRPAGGEQ